MKTNVHPNSLDTYFSLIESGVLCEQEKLVVQTLRTMPGMDPDAIGMTREQISGVSGIKLGSVCARINKLVESGIAIEVATTKSEAGRKTGVMALKKKFYQ